MAAPNFIFQYEQANPEAGTVDLPLRPPQDNGGDAPTTWLLYPHEHDRGMRLELELGLHDEENMEGAMARIHVYPLSVRIEALVDSAVWVVSSLTGAGGSEAMTPLQASTSSSSLVLQLRVGDELHVGKATRFKLAVKDEDGTEEDGKVQVSSSPVPEDGQDAGGPVWKEAESHHPGLLVERSITEKVDLGLGPGSGFVIGLRGQQQAQATSTPGASLGGISDERILDTPALETRHQDPTMAVPGKESGGAGMGDARLSSMAEGGSREFASAREQLSDADQEARKTELPADAEMQDSAKSRRKGRRKVVGESQESPAASISQAPRGSNVLQSTSANVGRPAQDALGSRGLETQDSEGGAQTRPQLDDESPQTSQGSDASLPQKSLEAPSQTKARPARKRKRSPVRSSAAAPFSPKRRRSGSAEDEATPRPTNTAAAATSSNKSTQWTFSADSSNEAAEPLRRGQPRKLGPSTSPRPAPPTLSTICFSNTPIPTQPKYARFLKQHGLKIVDAVSPTGCDLLCTGSGPLKRTSKLTLSVALGKPVVTDAWIHASHAAGHLLDPAGYLPSDPAHEAAWSFRLSDAIARGGRPGKLRDLLAGWTVRLTPALTRALGPNAVREIEQMACLGAGAEACLAGGTRMPRAGPEEHPQTLILASAAPENEDSDAAALVKLGWTVYSKDVLSLSILRGRLEIDGEDFRIRVSGAENKESGRRKGR